jgi:hypothetical protein
MSGKTSQHRQLLNRQKKNNNKISEHKKRKNISDRGRDRRVVVRGPPKMKWGSMLN